MIYLDDFGNYWSATHKNIVDRKTEQQIKEIAYHAWLNGLAQGKKDERDAQNKSLEARMKNVAKVKEHG